MLRRTLLLLAALAAAAFAPVPLPKPDSPKSELKKLQGTWALTELRIGERVLPVERLGEFKVVVAGERWTFIQRGRRLPDLAITLNVRAKPRAIDLQLSASETSRRLGPFIGIYALEGDTLKVAYAARRPSSPGTRPTEFNPKGTGQTLMIFKREIPTPPRRKP
jgi:uncharacterized protein (TIGR03067 family)